MAVEPQDVTLEEYNKRVAAWGSELGRKIRASIRSLTSKGKGDLLKSLRLKTAKWYGEIDKLSYHFVRHGVFLHKGVGRGYSMVGGKVMRVSGSLQVKFWREYAIKKGSSYKPKEMKDYAIKRTADEWFNPVVAQNIPGLADLITEMHADKTVNATKILIR